MANLTFQISTPGATYTISQGSTTVATGTVGSNSTVTVPASALPPGSYSIAWSYQGAAPRTDPLTITAGQSVYGFAPLAVQDTTATAGGATPVSGALGQVTTPIASTSTESYPFSYPAYNYGKYFTPTQTFMYIGDLYIDELVGFQYTLQSNKVPVFGYASSLMDAVGTGKSLVQGQLNINFVTEGYLYTVLNEYKNRSANPPAADEQAIQTLMAQYQSLAATPNNTTAQSQMTAIRQQMNQLFANNPDLATSGLGKPDVPKSYNAAYSKVPFDIVMKFEGGGRTVTKRIKKCVLTSNEQILGDNDSTLLDSYGFIARSAD